MTTTSTEIAKTIHYWDLLSFMTQTGWVIGNDNPSGRFIEFYGPVDTENTPLEIVFLRKADAREQPLYISNALEILSTVLNVESPILIQDINTVNKDVLRIRLFGAALNGSIPLKSASQQINELKQLVAYAARSEVDRRPYYLDARHPQSKAIVENYQFGHTFKGSFGFTIETPRLLDVHRYTQLSLIPEMVKDSSSIPVWRRVMERIARGLVNVDQATRDQDPRIIINNYEDGLNANMCQSLANMFTDEKLTVEYSIKWAAIKLPDDPLIKSMAPIQLRETAYNQLTYSARELIESHQEEVTISGVIIELSAKDSPMALDTSRTIRIQWFEPSEGKNFEATATLNREDYLKAIEAHGKWQSVQITGVLWHKKNVWRFVDYSKFIVNSTITD